MSPSPGGAEHGTALWRQIADEGKARRAAAEEELKKMEADLRDTLASARARGDGRGDTVGTAAGS